MQLTDYHAKYYAHELTNRCASDSLEKLAASLSDAQEDPNPHQVDTVLFAFCSTLSLGGILADEFGIVKTIKVNLSARNFIPIHRQHAAIPVRRKDEQDDPKVFSSN